MDREMKDVDGEAPVETIGCSRNEYPTNTLSSFDQGCIMDFRFRLCVDLMKSPLFHGLAAGNTAENVVAMARNITELLVTSAEAAGEIRPIENGNDLSPKMLDQAARIARFQVAQQFAANRAAQEMQPYVATPFGEPLAPLTGRN